MLSEPQKTIARDHTRFRTVVAGRRFGKTHLALRELCKWASEPGQKVWYIAPTYRQAKQTVWEPLKRRLRELRWIQRTNESDLTIELVNGSTISLRGSDNENSLRGVGLNGIVLDEFAYIDETAWTEVLRPTLSDTGGPALFITTPAGKSNWAYDLYSRGQDPSIDDWSSHTYTSLAGGRIPEPEIEAARRDLDERTFRQEYEASFETYSGVIYYNYSREHTTRAWELEVPRSLVVGVDFNVNPISAVVGVEGKDQLHIIDEIVIYQSNTDELVQELFSRYPNYRLVAYPDPAGVQKKTSAGGRSDITILENAGIRCVYPRRHLPVKDRINSVNSLLCNSEGKRRLWIDPSCRRLHDSLAKQTYKTGTVVPDKDSGHDHMNDSLGYLVSAIYPIVAERGTQEPLGRWSVRTS